MTLLQRLARLLKADLHGILDGLEDPQEVVKQTIRDMEEALTAKEQMLTALHVALQRLAAEAQEAERAAQEIEQRLDLCFQEGNDTLARSFIRRRLETVRQARRLACVIEETHRQREVLEHTVAEQRSQLARVVQQLNNLTAARQRQGGAAPFVPVGPDESITEDDIDVAFLQEKRRRTAPAQAH